jgi:hypothetical protein
MGEDNEIPEDADLQENIEEIMTGASTSAPKAQIVCIDFLRTVSLIMFI